MKQEEIDIREAMDELFHPKPTELSYIRQHIPPYCQSNF